MLTPSRPGRSWRWVGAHIFVLVTSTTSTLAFGVTTFLIGRHSDRQFLRCYRVPNSPEAEVEIPMQYALHSTEGNDVIFVGDSTCRAGIDSIRFERMTGLRAYNLGGQASLGVDGMLLIFRTYLDRHPRPRMMVLCVGPGSLGISSPGGYFPEMHDRFLKCHGAGAEDARPLLGQPIDANMRQGLWTVYARVTGRVGRFLDEPMPGAGMSYNAMKRWAADNRGFCGYPDIRGLGADYEGPSGIFAVLPSWRIGLRSMSRIAREGRIRLMIRLTPVPSRVRTENSVPWLNEFEKLCPDAIVSRPEILQYDPFLFVDGNHTNPGGVEKFTEFLAREATKALSGDERVKASSRVPGIEGR